MIIIILLLAATVCSLKMSTSGQVFVCTNKWCREKGSDAVSCKLSTYNSRIRCMYSMPYKYMYVTKTLFSIPSL